MMESQDTKLLGDQHTELSKTDVVGTVIHPFVHWAQSQNHISLRVDLTQAEDLNAIVHQQDSQIDSTSCLEFSAKGIGAHGRNIYKFNIDFYGSVQGDIDCKPVGRYVIILIKKSTDQQSRWPRLTKLTTKLPWLRVDFDRYDGDDSSDVNENDFNGSEDDDFSNDLVDDQFQRHLNDSNLDQSSYSSFKNWSQSLGRVSKRKQNQHNNTHRLDENSKQARLGSIRTSIQDHKFSEKNPTRRKSITIGKAYLILYNIIYSVSFLLINIFTIKGVISDTMTPEYSLFLSKLVRLMTYIQFLEAVHPIVGLIPGGPMMPFIQTLGRSVTISFLCNPNILRGSGIYGPSLLIVWSTIECIRYPFYLLKLFNTELSTLTWLRYTLFIPLYPAGGFLESMVLLSTITEYERTGDLSLELPNAANMSISIPTILKLYICLILIPGIYHLMKHMWALRSKVFNEKLK